MEEPRRADTLTLRVGEPADAERLAAFNLAIAEETEGLGLDPRTVAAGVGKVLHDASHGFYVVAERDERIVGALMVTYEWSDWRNALWWWVQSVYVDPRYRRRGVYRRLYDFVRVRARDHGNVCGFRLYVERDNEVAQRSYRALGMDASHYLMFEEELTR